MRDFIHTPVEFSRDAKAVKIFAIILSALAARARADDYPDFGDCRNETWEQDGGRIKVMSWHIHYNTVSSDMGRFYDGFVEKFADHFPPGDNQCPFGPNFGSNAYPYVCSLEAAYQLHGVGVAENDDTLLGGSPWSGPQRAFFIPLAWGDEAWAWEQANKGELDVLKHPNTGCMHDDHSVRAEWNSTVRDKCDLYPSYCNEQTCAEHIKTYSCEDYYCPTCDYAGWCDLTCDFPATDPTISILNFPCNVPGTGCNGTLWSGAPSCGCDDLLPLPDDAPEDACGNCINQYGEY